MADFMMNKDTIFRIALRCFNMDYDRIYPEEQRGAGTIPQEVKILEDFLRSATLFCIRTYKWSFLLTSKKYTESERVYEDAEKTTPKSFKGKAYAYPKPSDLGSIYYINGFYNKDFDIAGKNIFFDTENPEIAYISTDVDYSRFSELYPDDFGYLIAYRLGLETYQYLAPNDTNAANLLSQNFQMVFQSLTATERMSMRKANPSPSAFVF